MDGALVEVRVGWSAGGTRKRRAAFRPVPPALDAQALLDTGAEITCVDVSLIRLLGLPFSGSVTANLPGHGGLTVNALYDASLTVVHPSGNPRDNLLLRDLTILEVPLAALGYQVLIGRDVLARCRFLFNGTANCFTLAY